MKKYLITLTAAAFLVGCDQRNVEKASSEFNQLPAAVQKTVRAQAPNAEIADVEQKTRDGLTIYQIQFRDKERHPAMEVAADGMLMRYEAGTANLLGLVGLHAALELLLELGLENIAAELLRKRAWLLPALQAKGYTVLHGEAPTRHASLIVSFQRPGVDMAALHEKLTQAKIVASLRTDRAGNRYLRLSPHFYNTDAELERLLGLL